MFSKVKCPHCGAKNSKERMVCIECGSSLVSEQVERQLPQVSTEQVSTEAEVPDKTVIEKELKEGIENGYRDKDKTLHQTGSKTGELFSTVLETFRDKTRDELCANICAVGMNAVLATRGQREENVGDPRHGKSLGLIEIQGSPIRWVNVLKETKSYGPQSSISVHTFAYLIPDVTIHRETYLRSVGKRDAPIFGRVVDVRWKGNFEDFFQAKEEVVFDESDIIRLREQIRLLNEDAMLNQDLLNLPEEIEIYSYPEYGYWAISPKKSDTKKQYEGGPFGYSWQPVPSRELWDCYETIARHLLEPVEGESTGTAEL